MSPQLCSQGHQIRDDDYVEGYANVWYIYDDTYVNVTAPLKNNDYLGRCLYTGMCLQFWYNKCNLQQSQCVP